MGLRVAFLMKEFILGTLISEHLDSLTTLDIPLDLLLVSSMSRILYEAL